uniref:SGNH hydrolase-type esterase domain-containing protein n=1 Tax=Aegilops tauschii subsp. strangulata TaxID=200361 RepID=A0A453S9Q8_AEGTS
ADTPTELLVRSQAMASLYRGVLAGLALLFMNLLLILMARPPSADGASTAKSKISAVFVFGDSIVDPGNDNHRLTEAKADFPPYGQDFPGGKATGRFSNGKVPGDMLASRLGIKELLPPYLGDDLPISELLTGVVFASGGGGYDPFTSIPVNARSSTEQLGLFLKYKERLKASVGEDEMTRVISEGIYFTVMGANDLVNNYFTFPLRPHQYNLPSYVKFLVSSAVNFTMVRVFIKTLNLLGNSQCHSFLKKLVWLPLFQQSSRAHLVLQNFEVLCISFKLKHYNPFVS